MQSRTQNLNARILYIRMQSQTPNVNVLVSYQSTCPQHNRRYSHRSENRRQAELIQLLIQFASPQASNHNQPVSNAIGMMYLRSMDKAPPRYTPCSEAANHPRIQNANIVHAISPTQTATNYIIPEQVRSYSSWKYCDKLEDAKKRRIVQILYGKANPTLMDPVHSIYSDWTEEHWKIETRQTRKIPKHNK
eukprot:240855_1